MKNSFFTYTLSSFETAVKDLGVAKFTAKQIYQWIYQKHERNPEAWTNISKKNRDLITEHFDFSIPQIVWNGLSKDGTRKFLVKMQDGNTVETVAIAAKERLTLCISSQVGCAIGCTFCHTGTQGLKRHLKPNEIIGQFYTVTEFLNTNDPEGQKLTNIVYMGQGEPLHNYENVKLATEIFLEPHGFALSQRKITLSTSGLVPQIEKLGEFPPVNIAISLHSAKNNVRTELMPINKVYDLERLFQAIRTIPLKSHRRITYEYLLIDGLNDTPEDVIALSQLLKRKESKINLIPFNEYPGSNYKRPSNEKVLWFMDQLIQRGFTCTIRATKGHDILAACGQLKTQVEKVNLWNETSLSL
ncbi:MAG: 23S rRNA (adenine(2503)-C(2))-methyltransferase RlmN [Bacteriovoracaceae bacterium]|nr:23S rRNA (adenine(2503)-C(2))-methyltransferase RlmN [Bacteriovoracaceae bacterium]